MRASSPARADSASGAQRTSKAWPALSTTERNPLAQGYYISRPLPAPACAALLAREHAQLA